MRDQFEIIMSRSDFLNPILIDFWNSRIPRWFHDGSVTRFSYIPAIVIYMYHAQSAFHISGCRLTCFPFFSLFLRIFFSASTSFPRWMKRCCGQLIAKTRMGRGISGAIRGCLDNLAGENREARTGGVLLGCRLASHLFTVWKNEASIAGPRGSDERNVSSKRNRHLQIEYPPSSTTPVLLLLMMLFFIPCRRIFSNIFTFCSRILR